MAKSMDNRQQNRSVSPNLPEQKESAHNSTTFGAETSGPVHTGSGNIIIESQEAKSFALLPSLNRSDRTFWLVLIVIVSLVVTIPLAIIYRPFLPPSPLPDTPLASTPSPIVTPSPEITPTSAVAMPTATVSASIDPDKLLSAIDWGDFPNYFTLSNVRIESQRINTGSQIFDADVLAFTVEARENIMVVPLFMVNFYDAEGIEADVPSLVEFDPMYMSWSPGLRSRARVLLPLDTSQVELIRFH